MSSYRQQLIEGIVEAAREAQKPEPAPEPVPAEQVEAAAVAAFRRALYGEPPEEPEEQSS